MLYAFTLGCKIQNKVYFCEEKQKEKGGKSKWKIKLQLAVKLWDYTPVEVNLFTQCFSIYSRESFLTEIGPFQGP